MKFNIGQWVMKPGVRSCNAEQIRDYRLSADGTELFIFTLCHQGLGANLDGPALEIRVTSPQEDMIRLQTVHFKGDRRKYRKFEIDDRRLPLDYAEDETPSPSPPAGPAWSSQKLSPAALLTSTTAKRSPPSVTFPAAPCSASWILPRVPSCGASWR